MANVYVSAEEIENKTELSIYQVRRYRKLGILTPALKSREDGKTLLYEWACVLFRLEMLDILRLDFTLEELGPRFQAVFGRRDEVLAAALESVEKRPALLERFEKEILELPAP